MICFTACPWKKYFVYKLEVYKKKCFDKRAFEFCLEVVYKDSWCADCCQDTASYLQVVLAIEHKLLSVSINSKDVVITFVETFCLE